MYRKETTEKISFHHPSRVFAVGCSWFDVFQDEFGFQKNKPRVVFNIIKFIHTSRRRTASTDPLGMCFGLVHKDSLSGEREFDFFFLEYFFDCVIDCLLGIEVFDVVWAFHKVDDFEVQAERSVILKMDSLELNVVAFFNNFFNKCWDFFQFLQRGVVGNADSEDDPAVLHFLEISKTATGNFLVGDDELFALQEFHTSGFHADVSDGPFVVANDDIVADFKGSVKINRKSAERVPENALECKRDCNTGDSQSYDRARQIDLTDVEKVKESKNVDENMQHFFEHEQDVAADCFFPGFYHSFCVPGEKNVYDPRDDIRGKEYFSD